MRFVLFLTTFLRTSIPFKESSPSFMELVPSQGTWSELHYCLRTRCLSFDLNRLKLRSLVGSFLETVVFLLLGWNRTGAERATVSASGHWLKTVWLSRLHTRTESPDVVFPVP